MAKSYREMAARHGRYAQDFIIRGWDKPAAAEARQAWHCALEAEKLDPGPRPAKTRH